MARGKVVLIGADPAHRPTVLFTGLDPTNFRCLGALLHWPALRVVPNRVGEARVPEVMMNLKEHGFSHIVFTNRLGVRSFLSALAEQGYDEQLLDGMTIVATGAGTVDCLAEGGLRADIVPDDPGTRGILLSLEGRPVRSALLIEGTHAPGGLRDGLVERCARVEELSGGTRAKLNLGLALLPDPDILLLDEPYAGFDWDTYLRFWDLAQDRRSSGRSLLIVSHFVVDEERFDRIVQLRDGRVAQ